MSDKQPPYNEKSPSEQSPTHEFELRHNLLAEISQRFKVMCDIQPTTEYIHELFLHTAKDDESDPLCLKTTAIGEPQSTEKSQIEAYVPIENNHSRIVMRYTHDSVELALEAPSGISPIQIIAPLLEHDDTPPSVVQMATNIANHLISTNLYTTTYQRATKFQVPFNPNVYETLWQQALTDTSANPTQVNLSWANSGLELPNGEILKGFSINAGVGSDSFTIRSADIDLHNYYYFQQESEDGGTISEFEPYVPESESDLRPLKPKQLRKHPYSIVHSSLLHEQSLTSEHSIETGYVIFNKDANATVNEESPYTNIFEAQLYADWLYKTQLYIKQTNKKVTKRRAKKVIDTLDSLIAYIRKNGALPTSQQYNE